jgi:hypothetical protein
MNRRHIYDLYVMRSGLIFNFQFKYILLRDDPGDENKKLKIHAKVVSYMVGLQYDAVFGGMWFIEQKPDVQNQQTHTVQSGFVVIASETGRFPCF